jgi:CHAD domain-containing protein
VGRQVWPFNETLAEACYKGVKIIPLFPATILEQSRRNVAVILPAQLLIMSIADKRVRFVFEKVGRDLLKLSSRSQPEDVHNFRTTTRRLQTLFEELVSDRTRNQKKLLKLLDGIRKRAGKVRNVDVQLAALRSLKVAQEPRRKTQLMNQLIELRAKHERKLRSILTKQLIREIEKRLKRAAKDVRLNSKCDPLMIAREMLAQAVRAATLPGAVPSRAASLSQRGLHQCRITIKRARYAAEFAPTTTEAAQLVTQLKRLQDAIGNWHDWQALTNSATGQLGDIHQSSLVAELHNVTGGKLRSAVTALSASAAIQMPTKAAPASSSRKPGIKTQAASERTHSAA